MILLYGGRRPSDDHGAFPEGQIEFVRERLERLLFGLQPRLTIGSAAAGADLLVLGTALDGLVPAEVVLAGTRSEFRATSVVDKGHAWTERFDGIMKRPNLSVTELPGSNNDEGYALVNRRILERGLAQLRPQEELVLVAVTKPRTSEQNLTTQLIGEVDASGHLVIYIDPTIEKDHAPVAFVAMPYGRRRGSDLDQPDYNADATWHRILVPLTLNAGMRPVRVDLDASLEMIDAKMIRAIGRSSFFIADLAQHNPNVFWELGVRHAWVPSGTLLIAPQGTPRPPFDVSHVTIHEYKRDLDSVNDSDAVSAIRALKPLVEANSQSIDSPVFAALPELTPTDIPSATDPRGDQLAAASAERITRAADLQRVDALRSEVTRLSNGEVPGIERDWLLEQAAAAYLDLEHPQEAAEILAPLAAADGGLKRPILQQRYAFALMMAAEGDRELDHRRLEEAERLLLRLDRNAPGSGETLGLLGSVAKRRYLLARSAGADGTGDLARAIGYYEAGFGANPTDYYPGINAISLLVLRWHLHGTEDDAERARTLLSVLRFILDRPMVPESVWRRAARAEMALYHSLLGGRNDAKACFAAYALAAAGASPRQRASMRRQLELLATAEGMVDAVSRMLSALPES